MRTAACSAPPGTGGLGRHFAELLAELQGRADLACYYSTGLASDAGAHGEVVSAALATAVGRFTPVRLSPSARTFVGSVLFDRGVAAKLIPSDGHIGFAGQSLRTLERARELGCRRLELVSPTCHVDTVARQYAKALERYPVESTWLGDRLRLRTRREYALADSIHVASDYVRDSFLEAGFAEEKLRRVELTVDPRFQPPPTRPDDGVFRVVYVGGLTVAKGVPVLLEAFSRLSDPKAELTLVGGYGTRGMRRYLADAVRRDPRVRIGRGDPLPYLHRADAYVQPSFQDGFGYGPMEALACGLPVIVTADTGMKEYVRESQNGYVVPTGDVDAIAERLIALHESR